MLVNVKIKNENLETVVEYQTEINAAPIIEFAKEREEMIREKGKTFAQGAVPFWCNELAKAADSNDKEALEYAAINTAMAAWLADSIYGDLTEDQFLASDLNFALQPTGMVVYTRSPAK